MKIDELLFKNIQLAVFKKILIEKEYEYKLKLATNKIREVFKEAQLDPSKNYNMNEDTFEIEEIDDKRVEKEK